MTNFKIAVIYTNEVQNKSANYADLLTDAYGTGKSVVPVTGYWEGVRENSVMVTDFSTDEDAFKFALDVCKKYNQECVLVRKSDGSVWLIDRLGVCTKIGTKLKASPVEPKHLKAYTKRYVDDTPIYYYV